MVGSIGAFFGSAYGAFNAVEMPSGSTIGKLAIGFGLAYVTVVHVAIPVISKICSVVKSVFNRVIEWVNEKAIFMRLRSLGCQECASNHRNHVYPVVFKCKVSSEGV